MRAVPRRQNISQIIQLNYLYTSKQQEGLPLIWSHTTLGLAEFLGCIIPSQGKDSFMQLLCFFIYNLLIKARNVFRETNSLARAKSTVYLSLTAHRHFFDFCDEEGAYLFKTLLLGLLSSSLPPQPLSRNSGSKSKFWSKLHIFLKFTQLRMFKIGSKSQGYLVRSHLLFLLLLLLDHLVFRW